MMQNSNNSSMQKRQELVELFTQLGLPMGLLTQYTAQMRGKTQQQQEEIAQQIIDELHRRYPTD